MPRAPSRKPRKPWLIHHRHTAKVAPHVHTSYPLLAMVVLMVGVLLFHTANPVNAAEVRVNGTNTGGPLPPQPAIILSPTEGTNFTYQTITVSGTCPSGHIVKLYRNDLFSGSALCSTDGTWSVITDLFPGWNKLKARVFNHAGKEGPQSNVVNVFFDTTMHDPFYLTTENFYRAAFFEQHAEWEFQIIGGREDFETDITWGDGYSGHVSKTPRIFREKHAYAPGPAARNYYPIMITTTDRHGRKANLQVFTVVSATNAPGTTTKLYILESLYDDNWLKRMIAAWSTYGIILLMVISFWIGDRYGVTSYKHLLSQSRRDQRQKRKRRLKHA